MNLITFTETDIHFMERLYRVNFINSLSGFKSLHLVGTISKEGQTNLAIFSQVFHLGANPPLMGMIIRPDSVERHTLRNLTDTGYFTLNQVQEPFYKQAHHTSARHPGSEFDACNFTPFYTKLLPAPYVAESSIRIGLQFKERIDIVLNGTILIIGAILEVLLPADCLLPDGYINCEKAGTVTGSALDGYHTTQLLSRLAYAKPDQPVKSIS